MKRALDWAISDPNRTFAVVFVGLMLLGPVLASVLVHPLSAKMWVADIGMILQLAAAAAGVVFVFRRAPWLGWGGSLGVIGQAIFALFGLWAPFGIGFGFLHPASPPSVPMEAVFIVCSIFALVNIWGMMGDRWWAYLGEALLLCSLVVLACCAPDPPSATHLKTEIIPGDRMFHVIGGWWMFGLLNWKLIQRGFKRWRALRVGEAMTG